MNILSFLSYLPNEYPILPNANEYIMQYEYAILPMSIL